MALDPIDHVTAIARPRRTDAVTIHVGQGSYVSNTILDIDKDLSTPVARNLVEKLLTVTS